MAVEIIFKALIEHKGYLHEYIQLKNEKKNQQKIYTFFFFIGTIRFVRLVGCAPLIMFLDM